MNIFKRNHGYWLWYWRVFGVLLRRRFFSTSVVVVLSAASIVTGFLTFMLPLKVIILAGSEGVPRYFRFFIEPDEKWDWIIIFTVATIVCYTLTLLFDAVTRKMSVAAGSELLESANDLAVVSNQEDVVGGYYGKFCSLMASLLFALASMAVLALINMPVFVYVAGVLLAQFLLTAWALNGKDDVNPGPFKRYVGYKYKNYVSFLSNFIFLSGFLLILYPYLVGEGPNILFSLISFLLLRRMLGEMGNAVTGSVELEKARLKVNALLFREHQMVKQEKPTLLALRDAFAKPRRTALLKRVMAELTDFRKKQRQQPALNSEPEVCWQDSAIRFVTTLVVHDPVVALSGSVTEAQHYQVQVCSSKQAILLDKEERLFDYIPRPQLWAPEVLARFEEARFHCQLLRYGTGETLGRDWKQWEPAIHEHLWSTTLPDTLTAAYAASHRWLHQRVNEEFIRRVDIAVDTAAERQIFDDFLAALDDFQACLKAQPLAVHNPALKSDTVVHDGVGGVLVTSWGQWSLEPIGFSLPRSASDQWLETCIDRLKQARKDIPATFSLTSVQMIHKAADLERQINKSFYKAALTTMADLLTLLQQNDTVAEERQSIQAVG